MAIAVAHWDHPRVCGEHISIAREKVVSSGSSPRVRGTQALVHLVDAHLGIIPACAGNTPRRCRRSRPTRDHPRVCGEHLVFWYRATTKSGSSPRVRGTRGELALRLRRFGIILACAGNTTMSCSLSACPRDHPRVCGEHVSGFSSVPSSSGSSPRVRGTHGQRRSEVQGRGIIPACAGNTNSSRHRASRTRDHPRVCGEHFSTRPNSCRQTGSSPRVRGTLVLFERREVVVGIIPVCAGNTSGSQISRCLLRDHPRVCGEHGLEKMTIGANAGSSPRVRGTHRKARQDARLQGIIPACAGNTSSRASRPTSRRDHPRVCGEHVGWSLLTKIGRGSSPRVRGTLEQATDEQRHEGIIPACAGNTSISLPR